MRIVLDTNILTSALVFGGPPEQVVELGRGGLVELFASPFILEELTKVLEGKKFLWEPRRIVEAVIELKSFMTVLEPAVRLGVIQGKENDNRILECAVEAKAAAVITGNMRHIRPLGSFQGIEILTPREFLDKYFPGI